MIVLLIEISIFLLYENLKIFFLILAKTYYFKTQKT